MTKKAINPHLKYDINALLDIKKDSNKRQIECRIGISLSYS